MTNSQRSNWTYRGYGISPYTATTWIAKRLGRAMTQAELNHVYTYLRIGPEEYRALHSAGKLGPGAGLVATNMARFILRLKPVQQEVAA